MDGYFETRKQKQAESRDPVLKQMQDLSQTFQDTADRLTGIESNLQILMQKQISDAFNRYVKGFLTIFEVTELYVLSETFVCSHHFVLTLVILQPILIVCFTKNRLST